MFGNSSHKSLVQILDFTVLGKCLICCCPWWLDERGPLKKTALPPFPLAWRACSSQIWPDGTEYFGQWLSGKANGLGHIKHSDGDSYDGEWVNGRAHGIGVYRFQAGRRKKGGGGRGGGWTHRCGFR